MEDFEKFLEEKKALLQLNPIPENENEPEPSPPVGNSKGVVPAARSFSKIFQVTLWQEAVTHFHALFLLQGDYGDIKAWFNQQTEFIAANQDLEEIPPTPEEMQQVLDAASQTLQKRNLPPLTIKISNKNLLDPRFVIACDKIFDLHDSSPVSAKLKSIGMTTREFDNLKRTPIHRAYYNKMVDKTWDEDTFNEGRVALSKNVAEGDLASIKYFNEMTGKYVQQREFDPRVIGAMLQAIVGIVSRYVDTSVAHQISQEIDQAATQAITGGQLQLPTAEESYIDLD